MISGSSTAPPSSTRPDCPPPPDRSHGYVWPLGHLEIYSSRLDGSDLRPLTGNGVYNAEATLSPDGKRIIFTSTRDGDIDLYTMNIDGTDVRRITSRVGYDGGAWFSPDGKQIVWRAAYPVTAADTADYLDLLQQRLVRPAKVELWVANADGSNPRQITALGGRQLRPVLHPRRQADHLLLQLREPAERGLRSLPGQSRRHGPGEGHHPP